MLVISMQIKAIKYGFGRASVVRFEALCAAIAALEIAA
jgi:hypothetical protein